MTPPDSGRRSERLDIRPITEEDTQEVLAFERENRGWFERWVPPRPESYFDPKSLEGIVRSLVVEQRAGTGRFYLVRDATGRLVGRVNLVKRGGASSDVARLGYRVAAGIAGGGVATRAVRLVVNDVFSSWGVDRIEASTILGNAASEKVLLKNGFLFARREPGGLELHGRRVDRLDYVLERRRPR